MARIAKPPHIRILEAIAETLLAVDWIDRAGAGTLEKPLQIRHYRMRAARSDESPCISIIWDGNQDQDADAIYKTSGERVKLCNVQLVVDAPVKDETMDAGAPNDGDDPTGWLDLSSVAAVALEEIRDEDSPVMALATWAVDISTGPDEDSKPENGRLVQSIDVVYRVSSTTPNRLFAPGEN